ncbi:hypothetical protein QCN29_34965 [Streptomyces sp. HNM0663]|uniref:Uncharacterized protein n=1 Tax=Streptomyces chengmaiensis TaxID=3040919 RepID=A0ABT6HYT0_9ACTN|nr:hypothetical protein [Streptomyces chengmaiensis]MDH2393868.1 hypothetical protein [Streptomyces chengmaiensis]
MLTLALGATACGTADQPNASTADRSELPGGGEHCELELEERDGLGYPLTLDICAELEKKPVFVEAEVASRGKLRSSRQTGSYVFGTLEAGETAHVVCFDLDHQQVGVIVPDDKLEIPPNSEAVGRYTTRGGRVVAFVHDDSIKGASSQDNRTLWKDLESTVEKELGSYRCDELTVLLAKAGEQFRRPVGWWTSPSPIQ